jgi:hypothetical protein
MAIIKTQCSCGMIHEFDDKKDSSRFEGDIPEYIDCGECPECSPELLDTIEKHEDEAYIEEIDIEKLNGEVFLEEDIIEDNDIAEEEF